MRRALLPARLGLCTLLLASLAAAQSFDRLLPDSVIVYVSVEDVARSKERFQAGALARLWNDPAVKTFVEKPKEQWENWLRTSRHEEGFNLEDVWNAVAGQAAIAITSLGKDGDIRAVALIDIGANAGKVREMLNAGEERAAERDELRREEEEFAGVTIVSYRSETEDGETRVDGCWFLDGKTFAFGDDVEDLRKVLLKRGDEEGSLATKETYARVRRRLGARADLAVYVDGRNLLEAFAGDLGPEGMRVVQALGLANVEALGLHATLSAEAMQVDAFLPVAGEKEGVLMLFAGRNGSVKPPAFVPPDALNASLAWIDWPKMWEEARQVLDRIEEGGAQVLDDFVETVKGETGVDLATDVIDALGDGLTYYLKESDQEVPGLQLNQLKIPRFVMALRVGDRDRLDGAINGLLAPAVGWVRDEEYLGINMRLVLLPVPGVAPAFALLPDQLVFAMNAEDLKEVIARHGKEVKGLRDHEDFMRAAAGLPEAAISATFTREAKALHMGMMWMGLSQAGADHMLDMDTFPSAETLEKYLDNSLAVMVNEEDGVSYRYRMLFRPPPEKEAEDR